MVEVADVALSSTTYWKSEEIKNKDLHQKDQLTD